MTLQDEINNCQEHKNSIDALIAKLTEIGPEQEISEGGFALIDAIKYSIYLANEAPKESYLA